MDLVPATPRTGPVAFLAGWNWRHLGAPAGALDLDSKDMVEWISGGFDVWE